MVTMANKKISKKKAEKVLSEQNLCFRIVLEDMNGKLKNLVNTQDAFFKKFDAFEEKSRCDCRINLI